MQYFFDRWATKQLIDSTKFFFILVTKINSKKVCEKWKTTQHWKRSYLVCNRNSKLLWLVGATFDSKVTSLRRMRKKNLIILKSLQEKSVQFFVLFICRC